MSSTNLAGSSVGFQKDGGHRWARALVDCEVSRSLREAGHTSAEAASSVALVLVSGL